MHTRALARMTRRLTISVPDDIAERIDREPNASAFIAGLIRRATRYEPIQVYLQEELGVTEEGKARARERLRRARAEADRPEKVERREAFWAEVDAESTKHSSPGASAVDQ
jgi:hypothetical protein